MTFVIEFSSANLKNLLLLSFPTMNMFTTSGEEIWIKTRRRKFINTLLMKNK